MGRPRHERIFASSCIQGAVPANLAGPMYSFLMSCLSVSLAFSLVAQERPLVDADVPVRQEVAVLLKQVVETMDDGQSSAGAPGLEQLCRRVAVVADRLPEGSMVRTRLMSTVAHAQNVGGSRNSRSPVRSLRRSLDQLISDLRFKPYDEAPLPDGFPKYRAVDEIELKSYPGYRMVETGMRGAQEMGAFWVLFNHIKDRDIAMTSPVQVDYSDKNTRQEATMAFLYRTPDLGPAGPAGRADVVDVPPMMVASIGARGQDRRSRVVELRERLQAWLRSAKDEYEACGPMRVMSHNSPMVRGNRRFFEVQIPVRRVERTSSN